jgi:hypothetical protein
MFRRWSFRLLWGRCAFGEEDRQPMLLSSTSSMDNGLSAVVVGSCAR